jgi:hypothetical protein
MSRILEDLIIRRMIAEVTAAGFTLFGVNDGEEVIKADTVEKAREVIYSVDDSTVIFKDSRGKRLGVLVILGNGQDVLSDWHDDEGPFDAALSRVCDWIEGDDALGAGPQGQPAMEALGAVLPEGAGDGDPDESGALHDREWLGSHGGLAGRGQRGLVGTVPQGGRMTFIYVTDDLCEPGKFMDALSPDTRRRARTYEPRCSYPGCDNPPMATDIFCESCREAAESDAANDIGDRRRQLRIEDR